MEVAVLSVQYFYLFHSHQLDVFTLHSPPFTPLVVNIETACQVFMFTFQTRHSKFGGKKTKQKHKWGKKRGACFLKCCVYFLFIAFNGYTVAVWPRSCANRRAVRCEIGRAWSLTCETPTGEWKIHKTKRGGEEMGRDCLRNANVTVDGSNTGSPGPFLHIFSSMQSISGANLPQLSS